MKSDNGAVRSGLDHAEFAGLLHGNGDGRDGRLRAFVHVEFQHLADVHAVDVVGAEDHHEMRIGLFDQVDVLIDGVGGAAIPVLAGRAHLRRHGNDEVLLQQAGHLPAVAQVLQQALALELDQDVDGIDAGIDQVAEHEIDDAVAPAERHRRLGSFLGQRIKPRPFPSRQHKSQDPNLHGPYSGRAGSTPCKPGSSRDRVGTRIMEPRAPRMETKMDRDEILARLRERIVRYRGIPITGEFDGIWLRIWRRRSCWCCTKSTPSWTASRTCCRCR